MPRREEQELKQKRIINMIYGGPTDGDSHREIKASARKGKAWDKLGVLKIEEIEPEAEISFGPQDDKPMVRPHDKTTFALQVQPVEELMNIELFEGKKGYTTRIETQLRHAEMRDLITYLRKNADVFAFQISDLTGVDSEVALHCLNVDPAAKSVKQKLRQFGPEKDEVIREEVQKLLEAGHIKEVQFPQWLSNTVMVAKGSTRKWRMCIDFRDLNKTCPKDHYPLPRIDQLVDSTSRCQLLSMIDAY